MAEIIDSSEFEEKVIKNSKPVLVDFFAVWCAPCRMIAPFIDEIAEESVDFADVYKVDIDKAEDLCEKYGIRSVPTLLFFKGGEAAGKLTGAYPKEEIFNMLNQMQ